MLLPRNVQDLRRLRPVPALLPTHQLLQENGHQNEVGQCQKYGLSWAGGDWRLIQSHNCNVNIWNSATFTKFPGLQDSLTGLLSCPAASHPKPSQAIGAGSCGISETAAIGCTEEFAELTMTLTIVLKWDGTLTRLVNT